MKKYNSNSNIIGSLINKYRTNLNYTKADVCRKLELLGINLDVTELKRIEDNKQIVKDFELIGFIKVLNISLSELLQLIEC